MNELGNTPADKNYKPSGTTKAQEAALKAFPGQPFIHDRCVFRMGYEQAEKDLAPLIAAASIVYEVWNGGTIEDVRREMVELGKRFKEARQ